MTGSPSSTRQSSESIHSISPPGPQAWIPLRHTSSGPSASTHAPGTASWGTGHASRLNRPTAPEFRNLYAITARPA